MQGRIKRNKQQQAKIIDKRKADLLPPPMTEAADASADHHSPLTTSEPAIDRLNTGKPPLLPEGLKEEDLFLDLSFLDPVAPSPSLDKTTSAASRVSVPILPPVSPSLSVPPLGMTLSGNPAGASNTSASRIADPLEQAPAKEKNQRNKSRRDFYLEAKAERRVKEYRLFDIYTGKPAPEGAVQSEQNISFQNYVRRHVKCTKKTKATYVNAKTGKPAPGITKATHRRGQHTTLYVWQVSQKHAEFSNILEQGGNLPLPPSVERDKLQKTEVSDKQKAGQLPPPMAEVSGASAGPLSPLTASWHAYAKTIVPGKPLPWPNGLTEADFARKYSFVNPAIPSISPDKTYSATSSVTAPILPSTSHPLPTKLLDTSLSSNPAGAFDAYSAKASVAVTSHHLDPALSAVQDSSEQDPIYKSKPNLHAFFTSKEKDCAGYASKKAKTMRSDGSAEHLLSEADTPDLAREVFFMPSSSVKKPTF